MKLLQTKRTEIYAISTLKKHVGSVALLFGFCWCEFDFIYQFQIYFLCFQITVYRKQSRVSKVDNKQQGGRK